MYKDEISDNALKSLKQLDKQIARLILAWIERNLEGTDNPRFHGKSLSHDKKGIWRYHVGNYRLLANIEDDKLIILLIDFGHRKDIYK
jgi:mRNA interferase RelE/StbE